MAKTGDGESLGTAEGAVLGRASHTLHAENPILNDTWAVELLGAASQAQARDPENEKRGIEATGIDFRLLLAIGIGSLRYAEDEVERCAANGIDQYVVLGAGFDTFALRRHDLADKLRVFEVDFPDVQALKRERIEKATPTPAQIPSFAPVDFESMKISDVLPGVGFDPKKPSVWSWMNTIPYVSVEATEATLSDMRTLMAPGSRIVLNYQSDTPLTPDQAEYLGKISATTKQSGEPWISRWKSGAFEKVLADRNLRLIEYATEVELNDRYYKDRKDGMFAGVPGNLITAEAID